MSITIRVPFSIGPTGRIARAEGDYDIANQFLKTLIMTRFGERVMRPGYGSRTRDNVFENIDELMLQSLEGDIRDGVRTWEPGIQIHSVQMNVVESRLDVDIAYTLGSTLGLPPSTTRVTIDAGGTVEETS